MDIGGKQASVGMGMVQVQLVRGGASVPVFLCVGGDIRFGSTFLHGE